MTISSIVILTHNQLQYTQMCIKSIREYTEPGTYEIIVVDNASSDDTRTWLQEQMDLKVIYNDHNAGFPAGCNQGIGIAKGDHIVLLNNDTIVTPNWLNNLSDALYSSPDIGAVGPVTNSASYYQTIPVPYSTIEEMLQFASSHNTLDDSKREYRLKLIGFCMMIKRDVIEKIGLLDERFTPGNYEDDDYSFRIINAGYRLLLCKDTFIHHFGGVSFNQYPGSYSPLMRENAKKFKEKWGFDPGYSSFIRYEIIDVLESPSLEPIRVLEVGCACGGTLLEIKNRYPNAELHGIELNPASARIAGQFAKVVAEDVEKQLSYPEQYFDYIIFADVLEHLYDPWEVVKNAKKYLNENGKLLISVPNVMHHSVLKELLDGNWTYTDAGLLDRTHVRFFTRNEIIKLFKEAKFAHIEIGSNNLPIKDEEQQFINRLAELTANPTFAEEAKAYQYLLKVHHSIEYMQLDRLLNELNEDLMNVSKAEELSIYIADHSYQFDYMKKRINYYPNAQKLFNLVASVFYNNKLYDYVLPLLHDSLLINNRDDNTLYNIGYILYQAGERQAAIEYLEHIQNKDEEINKILEDIRQTKQHS